VTQVLHGLADASRVGAVFAFVRAVGFARPIAIARRVRVTLEVLSLATQHRGGGVHAGGLKILSRLEDVTDALLVRRGVRRRALAVMRGTVAVLGTPFAFAIAAVLGVIAVPMYRDYVTETQVRAVVGDIKQLEVRIQRFWTDHGRLPDSLAELGAGASSDPWGRPYAYLNIEAGGPGVNGQTRKDKNLVPINSDYDLYSAGPDGDSKPPLTAKPSRDDIVRAGNGGFVGLAETY